MAKKRTNGQTIIYINITKKTKDRATPTPIKTGELECSGKVSSSCSTCGTRRVTN